MNKKVKIGVEVLCVGGPFFGKSGQVLGLFEFFGRTWCVVGLAANGVIDGAFLVAANRLERLQ